MLSSLSALALVLDSLLGISILLWLIIRRARRGSLLKVQRKIVVNETVISNTDVPRQENELQLIDETGHIIPVITLPVIVGRASQNDIILNNRTISQTHARIYYEVALESICIEDCQSQNGIMINGHPTRKNVLKDGDKITLGNLIFTFRNVGHHA